MSKFLAPLKKSFQVVFVGPKGTIDQFYERFYASNKDQKYTAHFEPWYKEKDIMAKDQAPPKGGPIPSIDHGSTPAGAGNMDHGQSSVQSALSGKFTNKTVPVKIGSYPETGVPGKNNQA